MHTPICDELGIEFPIITLLQLTYAYTCMV